MLTITNACANAGPPRRPRAGASRLPGRTGPTEALAGLSVLVVADIENLSISAEEIGHAVLYDRLATMLHGSAGRSALHAFATIEARHAVFAEQLSASGWVLHGRPVERINRGGMRVETRNSDGALLLATGFLLAGAKPDALVIGSGDGELVIEAARTARRLCPGLKAVGTLSMPTSTNGAILARERGYIDFNILLGHDVLS